MANLVKYQQAFQAAGRFISVIQETTASLLAILGTA
jgi:flagellar hook-associated protein FlgK